MGTVQLICCGHGRAAGGADAQLSVWMTQDREVKVLYRDGVLRYPGIQKVNSVLTGNINRGRYKLGCSRVA